MGSYIDILKNININQININNIFELGSRDLIDANKLQEFFNCKIYAFECNPDCLEICYDNLKKFNNNNNL